MRYILKRAFLWILWHRKVYATVMIELAIGVCLLILGVNSAITANSALSEIKKSMSENIMRVSESVIDKINAPTFSITYEDYTEISREYDDILRVSFANYAYATFYDLAEGGFWQPTSFFMDNNMFTDLFGAEREAGVVYASKDVIEYIEKFSKFTKDKLLIIEGGLEFSNNQLVFGGMNYDIVPLVNNNNTDRIYLNEYEAAFGETSFVTVDKAIIFPVEMASLIYDSNYNGGSIMLLQYMTSDFEANIIPSVLDRLMQNHNNMFSYNVQDSALEMEKALYDETFDMKRIVILSSFLLLIIVVGIIGILLIFLNKRKKGIAISLAVGATFSTVIAELITEVFLISLTACVIGVAVAYFITPLTGTVFYEPMFHMESVLLGFIIAVLVAVSTSLFALTGIKNFKPMEILRQL